MWKSKGVRLVVAGLIIISVLMGSGCGMFNKPPVISSLTPSATEVARGESCTISCVATDPDEDILTYAWSVTGGALSGAGDTVTWVAPDTEGTYTISVTVSDESGEPASDSCTIEVVNNPPVVTGISPSVPSVAPEASCTVSCDASDADGDTLTYAWSATDGTIDGAGDTVTWTAPTTEGTYTIDVTVSDGQGGTAGASCEITVEMKYGAIDIKSDPDGAMVYLNGVDTGNITSYIITNLAPGTYTIKLEYYHYKYREAAVMVNADETTYINWSLTYAPEVTATIQPDAAEGKDATVNNGDTDENQGDYYQLIAGSRGWGFYRAYLQFSLDSLPENAVITSAKLGLCYCDSAISIQTPIGAYLVLGSWSESTITWDNQPACATTPEVTVNMSAATSHSFIYWTITNIVKGWWNGSITNYGLMLRDDEMWWDWKYFWSSDYGNASYRPMLVIYYFDPTP